jgi:hypothetical protein
VEEEIKKKNIYNERKEGLMLDCRIQEWKE